MSLVDERRLCAWCRGPIPSESRRDALTCSKPCRQAKARFRVVAPAGLATDRSMSFGYADPPYPGLARRYYNAPEVDHAALIARLNVEHPDGWALSTSSAALQRVLALCPDDVRVGAWVRGERRSRSYRPRDAWEPLIVRGGRPHLAEPQEPWPNALVWGGRQHSHPGALVGMKPAAFASWLFSLLGALPGDQLADIFPGSGAIARAWGLYTSQLEPRHVAQYSGDRTVAEDLRDVSREAFGDGSVGAAHRDALRDAGVMCRVRPRIMLFAAWMVPP